MNPNKEVKIGFAAKLEIFKGMNIAANAARPTLGPIGKTAIIENSFLSPIITDDGVTVLRSIKLKDPYANMGAELMKETAGRTNEEAGDGTTTTTIVAQEIIKEAMQILEKDEDAMPAIVEELDRGLIGFKEMLARITRQVKDDDLENVATIASLDPEVGKIIADLIRKTGRDGVVSVEESMKVGLQSEIIVGMRIESGLLSPYMITNFEKNYAEVPAPAIIVVDRAVKMNKQITPILKSLKDQGISDIILFADDVDGEALATCLINRKGGLNCAVVSTRKFGIAKGAILQDICAVTGARLISESLGVKLEEVDYTFAGHAENARITKDYAIIVGGKGKQADIDQRVALIRNELENSDSEVEKEILRRRLAALAGGIGVIRVGGYTETEVRARRYKIEDAVNATKCALEEGIVPGGGMALALAGMATTGSEILKKALQAPLEQMARNAGVPISYRIGSWPFRKRINLLNYIYLTSDGVEPGFNFKTKKVESNMFQAGLVDPVKVSRLAVENAVSIAKVFITAETVIVDDPSEKNKPQNEQ